MNIVFAGTPEFAVPTLQALVDAGHRVCAVFTQPDRPAGRGRQVQASPVKQHALALGLPVEQPESLKNQQECLSRYAPDLMVVVAYGLILPESILSLPKHGCLNVHASLLPRWRGAAPIQRAIEAGDAETGITIMQMNAGLDTGDMLYQCRTAIQPSDTAETLHNRLALLGADALVKTLQQITNGTLHATIQDNAQATYAAKISKEEGRVDWQLDADQLWRKVRAFNPWPLCFFLYNDKRIRLWGTEALNNDDNDHPPGSVVDLTEHGPVVQTGHGQLLIQQAQPEGGRRMSGRDLVNGLHIQIGDRFL